MSSNFRGIIPPVVTPLLADGSFDRDSFIRHLNNLIQAGVHGLFILGSSGEVVFSTDERRKEIIQTAVQTANGKLPVMVGCIDMQTERVIAHARQAEALGADAIVATAPFYALGGPDQVERHFRLIRRAVNLPLFAYDIPVCVHTKLPVNMLVKLGQDAVLAGVKDSSGDDVSFRYLVAENRRVGSPLTVLTGHEVVVDGAYLSGADGAVPGLANVDPHGYIRQWQAYTAGDWDGVRREQDRLAQLMTIASVTSGVSGFGAGVGSFKTALALQGVFATNRMPEPVPTLLADNISAIANVLQQCGLEVPVTPQQVDAAVNYQPFAQE